MEAGSVLHTPRGCTSALLFIAIAKETLREARRKSVPFELTNTQGRAGVRDQNRLLCVSHRSRVWALSLQSTPCHQTNTHVVRRSSFILEGPTSHDPKSHLNYRSQISKVIKINLTFKMSYLSLFYPMFIIDRK